MDRNIHAVMEISSLDLTLQYHTDHMINISHDEAEETQKLTANMGEFVGGINNASTKSAESATDTISALNTMTEKMGDMTDDPFYRMQKNKRIEKRSSGAISFGSY